MALLTDVTLSDTFNEWRLKTNLAIEAINNITDDFGDIAIEDGHIYLTGSGGSLTVGGEASGVATITDLTNMTVNVTLSSEAVQDRASALFTNGNHTGVSATYNDSNNTMNLALTADPQINLSGAVTGTVTLTNLASISHSLTTTLSNNVVTQANMADDAVGSAELKNVVSLVIYNSSGTALKTIYGAGS